MGQLPNLVQCAEPNSSTEFSELEKCNAFRSANVEPRLTPLKPRLW